MMRYINKLKLTLWVSVVYVLLVPAVWLAFTAEQIACICIECMRKFPERLHVHFCQPALCQPDRVRADARFFCKGLL